MLYVCYRYGLSNGHYREDDAVGTLLRGLLQLVRGAPPPPGDEQQLLRHFTSSASERPAMGGWLQAAEAAVRRTIDGLASDGCTVSARPLWQAENERYPSRPPCGSQVRLTSPHLDLLDHAIVIERYSSRPPCGSQFVRLRKSTLASSGALTSAAMDAKWEMLYLAAVPKAASRWLKETLLPVCCGRSPQHLAMLQKDEHPVAVQRTP